MGFLVVGLDFAVHQRLDFMRVEVARHHHAQVVRHELHHMVVRTDAWVFGEQRRLLGVLNVSLDRHQPFLARLLQDVVEQRHQVHVARLGVLVALERCRNGSHRGLEHLGLVVHDERPQGGAANRDHFKRQRLQQHVHVAAVGYEYAENAPKSDGIANDDEHVRG